MFAIEIHLHLMKQLFAVLVSIFWISFPASSVKAQFPATDYPQHYFRDPLGIPMKLAANFGELRANHYHMGLDIRTQHRENLPVYAAADGYVARVEVGPFGFGQAIYIRHPNGYTTVYGHLNRFFPALAAYVEQQQYRQQSWEVDLAIPSSLFPVIQGQLIAWSGNTGGSQGPHLHFEIRLTREEINLNPLLFGLPVPDRDPPKIERLAWYDAGQGIYEQSPHILPVRMLPPQWPAGPVPHASAGYQLTSDILTVPVSRIGFALSASDVQSGSTNPNGIYRAVLSDDGRPIIGFQLDHISYDDTRNINAHIDYKTRIMGGPFLQQLFFLPGYPFPSIYRVPIETGWIDPAVRRGDSTQRTRLPALTPDGMIDLGDGLPHHIVITVTDTRENTGRLAFTVQYRPAEASAMGDSIAKNAGAVNAPAIKRFYPGMVDGLETPDFAFYLGERSLYDSAVIAAAVSGSAGLGLSMPDAVTPVVTIGGKWIPLLQPMLVRLHLPDGGGINGSGISGVDIRPSSTEKIVMVCFDGGIKEVRRPEWKGDWASARFGEFGNFQLVEDTIPPVIVPIGPLQGADLSHAGRIAFDVRDNLGGVRHFRAEIDGRWICFTNDKALAWIYKFDKLCPRGPHVLRVSVEDIAGNRSEEEYHFNR